MSIKLEKGDFDSFVYDFEVFVQKELFHILIDIFQIDCQYISESFILFFCRDIKLILEDHLIDHKFESEIKQDHLIGCYLDEGLDFFFFRIEVISSKIWCVFQDAEKLGQLVDNIVEKR